MIRINLLPSGQSKRSGGGKGFPVLAVLLLLLLGGALFYLQSEADSSLSDLERRNASTEREIEKLKVQTAEVAQLETQKAELKRQKDVLDGLIEGQGGPVNMLFALSEMLRTEDDPQRKLEQTNRGWNPDWDPKRLWIDGFIENSRLVKISGHARSNEDLAEFHHRLESSKHFVEVTLRFSETIKVPKLKDAKFVRFAIDAVVLYGQADVNRFTAGELTLQKKTR